MSDATANSKEEFLIDGQDFLPVRMKRASTTAEIGRKRVGSEEL